MLEKKHLVFLAGATAPFAPPTMYGPALQTETRLQGKTVNSVVMKLLSYVTVCNQLKGAFNCKLLFQLGTDRE